MEYDLELQRELGQPVPIQPNPDYRDELRILREAVERIERKLDDRPVMLPRPESEDFAPCDRPKFDGIRPLYGGGNIY